MWACSRRIRDLAAGRRQEDAKACPLAGNALDFESAAVVLNHAMGDGEPQARAVTDILGREERIEDLWQVLVGDPAAVVGDFDLDLAVR